MQYMTLYTPDTPSPMPSADKMEKMNELTNRELAAGGLGHRDKLGMRVSMKNGKFTVTDNPPGQSVLMAAGSASISEANTKEEFLSMLEEFLAVAGDGSCEVLGFAFPLMTSLARSTMGGVIPSFMVDGATAASEFYQKAFAARELRRYAHEDGKRLMHCHMEINGGSIMFNDPMPEHGYAREASSSYTNNLVVTDGDLWWNRAVEAGCKVSMPFERAFWGDRFGRLVDPFGIAWAIDEPSQQAGAERAA